VEVSRKKLALDIKKYLGVWDLVGLEFMNCMILARRAFSDSSSSGVIAAALRFKETGILGVETLRV
jgi:hypothetical protein